MAKTCEVQQTWTFSGGTTGGGKAIKLSPSVDRLTAYFVTSSGCTATVSLQTAAGSSEGPWIGLEASTAMSSNATLLKQFVGPLEWVRPYMTAIKASTDVITVYVRGN